MAEPPVLDAGVLQGSVPTSLTAAAIFAVVVLAGVVAYLFRYYSTRIQKLEDSHAQDLRSWAAERISWAAERTRLEEFRGALRAEYESRHKDSSAQYADSLKELYDKTLDQMNAARREYAANMEFVATEATKAAEKTAAVLDRLTERYVNQRRPS